MTFTHTTTSMERSALSAVPWKAHAFQKRAVEFGLKQCAAGFFLDPGLGKTSILLKIIKTLKESGAFRCALVVAPLRVCHLVWPAEIAKWRDFKDLTYSIVHGNGEKQRLAALSKPADIYVINPDGLRWLLKADKPGRSELFRAMNPDVLVIDESTQFKRASTQRFKLLKPYLPMFKRRYILTGSPNPNGYLDLFGQIYCLDLGASLSQYYTHYRFNYFQCLDKFGWNWVIQKGAEERIQRQIKPLVIRLDAEDYLKLPKLVENTIRVELPPAARTTYDELEKELFTQLAKGIDVVALNKGAAMVKCSQVANGGLFYEDALLTDPEEMLAALVKPKRHFQKIHDEKTNALLELIEELQHTPIIVAYEYEHDLARLLEALGKDTPVMGGGTSMTKSKHIEADWNAGNIPVLLAHPAAMGHGLNLQSSGNHVCWYNITWNYELYDQFIRRVRRQGQKASHVFVHHIVAHNTVDEAKMTALRGKERTQRGLLNALNEYRRYKG